MRKEKKEVSRTQAAAPGAGEVAGEYLVKVSKTQDFIAKIFCLIGAFLLWLYAANTDTTVQQKVLNAVPISVVGNESSLLSVYSGYNSTVDVVISGRRNDIKEITENDVKITVDISSITEAGKYKLPVEIELPNGIELVENNPDTVSMYIDNKTSITVPVKIKTTDTVIVSGYELGTVELSEEEVVVTGPEAVLDTIEFAQLTVSLGRVTASMTYTGSIELIDHNGESVENPYLKTDITDVSAEFPVFMTKEVPLTVGYRYGYWNAENVNIIIDPATVRLRGKVEDVNRIEEIQLAVLDEKKLGVSNVTYSSYTIQIDDDIENVDGKETALVQIEQFGTSNKTLILSQFGINNPNGLKYNLNTESIAVTIRAPSKYIAVLDSAVISGVVDLANYTNSTGVISVPLDISINGAYSGEVYEIGDYSVSILIE